MDITKQSPTERELQSQVSRLQILTRLNQIISSSLDLDTVLREIARAAATLMEVPLAEFWLVDETTRTLELCSSFDESLNADYPLKKLRFDQGAVGWIAMHGQPLHIPDMFLDARIVCPVWWRSHNLRSFYGLPIRFEHSLLAVLAFNSSQPFSLTPDVQDLLENFGAQAAIAIRNASLYGQLQRSEEALHRVSQDLEKRVTERTAELAHANMLLRREINEHTRTMQEVFEHAKQLEAIRGITTELTRELKLSTLLHLIIQRAVEIIKVRSGAIRLWDETTRVLVPGALYGKTHWMKEQIGLGEGVAGMVAQSRKGMRVNDYRHSPYAHPLFLKLTTATAVLAAPLLYHDRLLGVIVLNNEGIEERLFSEQDGELLNLFAAQAAIAIENARLYEALEAKITRLQTLTQLNRLVSSSLDLSKVLDEIVTAAAELMQAEVVRIWMVNQTTQMFELQAVASEVPLPYLQQPQSIHDARGGLSWVATHRTILNVPNGFEDDRIVHQDWFRSHGFSSLLIAPIMHGDSFLAALSLVGRKPFQLSPEEQMLLENFIAQAATAIHNASLYERLVTSEGKFRQLAENIEGVLWMTSPKYSEVLYVNPAYEKVWGRSCSSLYASSLSWIDPIHPEDRDRVLEAVQTKQFWKRDELVYRIVRPDGTIRWIRDRAFPIRNEKGEVYRVCGIAEDITERKAIEERLIQHERLASVMELAAGIAHEIRNPLSSIYTAANLLPEVPLESLQPKHLTALKTIKQETKRLKNSFE